MNHYLIHETPVGELVLKSCSKFLLSINFFKEQSTQSKTFFLNRGNLVLEKTAEQLDEYFFHNRISFSIDYILCTTPFFTKVLKEVSLIQFGEIKSYKQIANLLNNSKACRAVANANANNPLPIIIPCHRVIRSSGELGGYRGGFQSKRYLLNLENKKANF